MSSADPGTKLKKGFDDARHQPMFFAALIAESDGVLVIAKQPVGASALAAAKKKTPKGVVVLGRLRWDKDAEKFKFGCRGDGSVKAGLKQILKAALQGSAPKFELEDPKLAATEPAEEDDDAPGVDAELRKHLAGAKSARRFFALVGTAPVKGKLLLSGKNVPSEAVADAKKAFQASTCQRGIVEVVAGVHTFLFAKKAPQRFAALIKALIKRDTGLSLRVALGVLDNLSELGEQGPGDDPPQDSEPNFEEWNALAGPLRTDFKAAAASGVAKETLDRARELYEESKALAKAEQFEAAIAKLHDFEAALDRLAPPTELNAAAWKARVLRVKKRLLKFPRADPAFRPLERLYHRAVAEGNAGNRQASDATLERLERELALASEAPPVAARQAPGEPRPNKAVRVQGEVSRLLAEIADRTSSSEQGDAAERIRASLTAVARYLKISPAMRIEKLREAVAKAYLAAQEALQGDDHALAEAGMQRALEAMEHAEAEQKEAQRAWDSLDDLRNQTEAGVAELEKMDDFAAPKFRYVLRHSLREGSRGDFVDAKKRLTDLAAQVAKAVADKDARAIWTARLDDESLATDALQDFEALNQRIVDAAVPGLGRIVEVDDLVELRQTLREALEQERWQPSSDVLDELIAAVNRVRQTATDRTALLELAATDKRDTAIYEPLFQLAAETTSPPDDEDDERWKAYLGANEAFGQAREALTLARANFVNDPYELSNAWTDAIRTAEAVLRARKKFYGKDSQDAARLEYEQRVGELDAPKLRKALETPNFTRETRTAKQRLTRLTEEAATHARAGEYKAALAILNRLDEAVGEVKLAARYASYDSRHVEAFWSEGASKRAIVEKAQISPETHGDAARLKGIYDAAESAFDQAWSEDKFAECLGELGEAMSVALDAVVQSLAAQVAREAEALQEEVDQLKTPDEAQNFINAAGDRLREFPAQVQISLLKILRAEGLEGPGKAAARNTVYRAMKLDAAFLKEDEAARSKCVEAVAKMKEVAEAQANWNRPKDDPGGKAMSLADKLSILEKIAAAQCEAYGFEGPPKIRLLNLGASGAAGYFRSGEKDIVLNSDSGSPIHHDFKEILDTILHENMHVYQHQLVHGVAELEEDDPRQTQVDLFSINDAAEGYCDPNEDGIAYKMQPQEAHAYLTGETATQAILAKLPPA